MGGSNSGRCEGADPGAYQYPLLFPAFVGDVVDERNAHVLRSKPRAQPDEPSYVPSSEYPCSLSASVDQKKTTQSQVRERKTRPPDPAGSSNLAGPRQECCG